MQLEICSIGHLGANQADALLKNTCDEADSAGKSIKACNDDLGVLALGQLNGSLQFNTGVIFSGLNIAELSNQRSGTRHKLEYFVVLSRQTQSRLALAFS